MVIKSCLESLTKVQQICGQCNFWGIYNVKTIFLGCSRWHSLADVSQKMPLLLDLIGWVDIIGEKRLWDNPVPCHEEFINYRVSNLNWTWKQIQPTLLYSVPALAFRFSPRAALCKANCKSPLGMSDSEQGTERIQLEPNSNLKDLLGYGCHLFLEQEPWVEEDLQIEHCFC